MVKVSLHGESLRIVVPFTDIEKARGIPQRRWLAGAKCWSARPSLANLQYITNTWEDAELDEATWLILARLRKEEAQRERVSAGIFDVSQIDREYAAGLFKGREPWLHQKKALLLGREMPYFGYIMDQGTGKSRTVCDDAAFNYRAGTINGLIVLNKNSVKTNWVSGDANPDEPDAIDQWLPDDVPRFKAVWFSDANAAQKKQLAEFDNMIAHYCGGLAIISINYDALNMDRAYKWLEAFCKKRSTMIVADESTMLGLNSSRTKNATKLRKLCVRARILTGTPIVQSPLKAFYQWGFLSEDILGFGSFFAFKARHCIMGGFEGRQVLKFVNLDELSAKIYSCSFRVLKTECMDLPPKIYSKRYVYMTEAQSKAYSEMAKLMRTSPDGRDTTAIIKLTQVMRLQQITGGYVKADDGSIIELVKPEHNPLFKEVLGLVEEAGDNKVLVWAHFREEIRAIVTLLREAGYRVGEFHGGVPEAERLQVRRDMKNGLFDVLVSNQSCGGMGIDEFKIANVEIFLSNSDKTEDRLQAEDRAHRGGSEIHDKITIYDLVVPNTVRVKLIRTLRNNRNISDEVMRDGISEWI